MIISVKYGVFTRNAGQHWLRAARGMPALWCPPSDTVIALVIIGHFHFMPCSLLDPTDWVTTEGRYGRENTTLFMCCASEIAYVWQRTPRGQTTANHSSPLSFFLLILSCKTDRTGLIYQLTALRGETHHERKHGLFGCKIVKRAHKMETGRRRKC